MKFITRVAITLVCMIAAIGCYAFGVPAGGLVFLVVGVLFEGLFWFGVFGLKKK